MTRRSPLPPQLPAELKLLDAELRQAAERALGAPVNQVSRSMADRVLARASGTGATTDAEIARVVDPRSSNSREIKPLLWLAAAAVLLAIGLGTWQWQSHLVVGQIFHSDGELAGIDPKIREGAHIEAPAPFSASLDGFRILMLTNRGADVTVTSRQEVALAEGAVWFEIEPQSGPFRVRCGDVTVSVVGTIFGVSESGGQLTVEVARGKVRIESPGGEQLVAGGERWESKAPGEVVRRASEELPGWAEDLRRDHVQAIKTYFPSAMPTKSGPDP